MSRELDLSDPRVRAMADRNHTPAEMWSMGGDLISLHCDACGHGWPCPTRQALDDLRRPPRSALPEVPESGAQVTAAPEASPSVDGGTTG